MDGFVWPLKEQSFAIGDELDAEILVLAVEIVEARARQDDGGGDVVLDLHFFGGKEIGAKLINAPGFVSIVADAQVVADERLVFEFEFVAEEAVDAVDGEMLPPVLAPLGTVIAL